MFFFFQAEDGIRDLVRSRGLGDVYKRQLEMGAGPGTATIGLLSFYAKIAEANPSLEIHLEYLSLIHI